MVQPSEPPVREGTVGGKLILSARAQTDAASREPRNGAAAVPSRRRRPPRYANSAKGRGRHGASGRPVNAMDWTNPLVYILGFTVLMAAGTALWKVFWWVAKVDAGERDFRTFTTEVRKDIKLILLRVNPVIVGQSPMRLNQLGQTIATRLQAQEWATELAPKLLAEIEGLRPSEIARFCHEYVNKKLGDEWAERLDTAAYEHGVDQDAVQTVLWIVLQEELIGLRERAED